MRRKLAWLAAIACVAWLVPAWALSLGGIRVHSRLNQPLTASIPIYAGNGETIDENVKIRVAPNQDYVRAGLERLDFLSDLTFTVEPDRVVITSRRAVREPVVDLLLEVQWSGGRLLRQYTMLLDPEGVGAAPTPLEPSRVAVAPTPETGGQAASRAGGGEGNVGSTRPRNAPPSETPPLTATPSRRGPVAVPGSAATESTLPKQLPRTYGPVRPNETPWSVASKLKPDDSVTTEQVIIALFQWNPTAFAGNLTSFKPGATLRVPDAEVMRRVDPQIAKSRVEEARARSSAPEAATPKPSAGAAESTPPAIPAAPPKAEVPAPKVETPVETAPSTSTTPTPAAPATGSSTTATPAPATEQPAATAPPAAETPPAQETPPPAAAPAPAPEKKEGMGWMLPAVIAIAVLFFAVLVWRLMRRPKSPGEDFPTDDSATLSAGASSARPARTVIPDVEPEPPAAEPEPVLERATILPEPEIPEPPQRVTIPPPPAAAPPPPPAPAPKPMGMPSFSDTALTDTRQIDLEGGDALAEADFHLAYGLYDEAILLLTQALTRDPNRNDVRTKLAEAYFSANRGQEFLDTARALKGKLDATGWEKIAVLGRQLFPSEALFGGSGKAQPAPSGEVASAPRAPSNTLSFDMPAAPPPPPAKPAESASVPFELGSLDLDTPLETSSTSPSATSAQGLDLESHISIDESGMGGDESSTKLDLARAYIDLGDNDMARGLLSEVVQQGTSEQKQAAEELMRKLPA